jgi:RNA polymerase sigma-70 factor (ECF subfamily)
MLQDDAARERRDLGPDEAVVRRVLAGEIDLYEVIMRRYNRRLFRVARSIVREDDEAEDVMQDAYVRAYEHLRQFEGASSFGTWLTRIAVHEALARVRRRNRNASLDEETVDENRMMATKERTAEQNTLDRELRVVLEDAVDALPPAFRAVFILRTVEEMSTAEVAAALEIPEDTVKTRLFRARGLLQKTLTDRIDGATRETFAFERPRCDRVVASVFERIGRIERGSGAR